MEEALNEDDKAKKGSHNDKTRENKSTKCVTSDEPRPSTPNIRSQSISQSSQQTPSFQKRGQAASTPKVEESPPQTSDDHAIFLTPTSKKPIPFKSKEQVIYEVESSDEDDVVEVALPPKPTITIESSDEDDLQLVRDISSRKSNIPRATVSRSPSVVSSISDEFIRNDCIALNISTQSSQPSFDFSLHGSDLLDQRSPSKKKKRRRDKDASPPTTLFATPKNKSKRKRKSIKTAVNQSFDLTKDKYTVTPLSIPNADVYETDSNQSAPAIDLTKEPFVKDNVEMPIENIVMANVTGSLTRTAADTHTDVNAKYGSTRVPAILFEKLDFGNLKGDSTVTEKRYSPTTLRHEMDKFYNESWGGEDFNHSEIQKHMSNDKSLWAIDSKDRFPNSTRKKSVCFKCNRIGHREEHCHMRSAICFMCGESGHQEPRCPSKICVNCGSPNLVYSAVCRNCTNWGQIVCPECGQKGHPYTHCPDLWRRYHNTTDNTHPLVENNEMKRNYEQYCSGCAKRGHLVHTCKYVYSFAGMALNSPYVAIYRPMYPISPAQTRNFGTDTTTSRQNALPSEKAAKRHSSSPIRTDHAIKRRSASCTDNKLPEVISTTEEHVTSASDATTATSPNRDKRGQIIQYNQISNTSDILTTTRIYITKDIIDKLKHAEGEKWSRETCAKHNVIITYADDNSFLNVTGKVADQIALQNELKAWTHMTHDTHAARDMADGSDKSHNIPKDRDNVLRQLEHAFAALAKEIGDPKKLFKELTYLQNQHKFLLKQKVVKPTQLMHNRNNTNGIIRKLNMVLLGQAGLADGCVHLRKLRSIHERLTACAQKYLTKDVRHEIGQHYHYIFTVSPRDDYHVLINMYYSQRKVIVKQDTVRHERVPASIKRDIEKAVYSKMPSLHPEVGEMLNMSTFTYERLMKTRPKSVGMRKRRLRLLRLLQDQLMVIINEGARVSQRVIKRLTRLQQQSQLFFSNNV